VSSSIPGPRQAAVALVALGPERAATVLRGLGEEQARLLAAEVAALGPVNPSEVRTALNDLARDLREPGVLPAPGKQLAKDLLVRALGADVGTAMGEELDVPTPFAWLAQADPQAAGQALAKEPAGAVALALAHVEPRAAARLLAQLPPEDQARVATRIAGLGTVHPDTVRQVETALRARVSDLLQTSVKKVDGPELLAGVLAKIGRDAGKELLQALAASNPELAAATRDRLFTFEDLCGLEARTLQTVLRAVDSKQLALALRGLDAGLTDAVLANLSERAREALLEEMELITTSRPSEVAEARAAVVAAARQLEDEGTVVLMKDGDE
jgi:flagellar motor switch protein FliG